MVRKKLSAHHSIRRRHSSGSGSTKTAATCFRGCSLVRKCPLAFRLPHRSCRSASVCPLGFLAAIFGGWVDTVLSRIVDTVMCIPVLISALVILQALGSSLPVLIITIALLDSTRVFRLARIVAQGVNVLEYAETARLRGEGLGWLIWREILPNTLPPLIAEFGLRFCFTFLFVAGLSFLGLGIQPPFADWGGMVKDNQQAILYGLYAPLFPAAAIAILTVGVNLVVDWLLAGRTTTQGADR
ncbi:Dipeptide transport system permease protein dppC [Brucella intermedia LMG 3301]|uniref:Dipeptide transport system permease protein dppC n=1 Tax=Brucella intermedia LMG 3301 TaxID=641118 RepID=C4WP37_9HYPH|nr:Dipeptide transport system permease protein dppC [Brucella intermedia LMG 3301]